MHPLVALENRESSEYTCNVYIRTLVELPALPSEAPRVIACISFFCTAVAGRRIIAVLTPGLTSTAAAAGAVR